MISMIRIDDRLIHGQVAVKWSKELSVNRIIVPNDQIATNEIQKSALMMAAPTGVKVVVMPVVKAAGLLNDPRSESLKILVVTNNPKDVAELLSLMDKKIPDLFLDMANYGRIGGALSEKTKIAETVYLTEADKKVIQEIKDMGYDFTYQPLPDDPKLSLYELMEGK